MPTELDRYHLVRLFLLLPFRHQVQVAIDLGLDETGWRPVDDQSDHEFYVKMFGHVERHDLSADLWDLVQAYQPEPATTNPFRVES